MSYTSAYLNAIDLGIDASWIDEWNWTPYAQTVRKALDGSLVIERISPAADGRPITMFCSWVSKAIVDAVVALRDSMVQDCMTITVADGREFNVLFRHHDGPPVIVTPVLERPDYINVPDPDYYDMTINLIEVDADACVTTTT